jgi:hypothetical protein
MMNGWKLWPKVRPRILISYVMAFLLSCYVITASSIFDTYYEVDAQPFPSIPSSPASGAGLPTIQITSVQEGQQVPSGELTIQGISSDSKDTDCEVFADVYDVTLMQNVTAAGECEGEADFSTWTCTYTEDCHLIAEGQNERNVKISCISSESDLDFNTYWQFYAHKSCIQCSLK